MKSRIAVLAVTLTALLMLPASGPAQAKQKASTLTIVGHAGEAQLLQINGKSYVEVETLARLTHGSLSFKANQTILTLPPSASEAQAPKPQGKGRVLKSLRPGGH
jgi:lipopolysaccharide export system protein LptA